MCSPARPTHESCVQGVLLQIFTQPVSDRPTVFLEIIQRIGCMKELTGTAAAAMTGSASKPVLSQAGGCGKLGLSQLIHVFIFKPQLVQSFR